MRLCTDLVKKRVGLKYIRNAKKMRILSAGKYLVQLVHYTHWYLAVGIGTGQQHNTKVQCNEMLMYML